LQVKIRNWMDNVEATELVGVSARFGEKISDRNVEMEAIPLVLPSLGTSCNSSSIPVSISSFLLTVPCFSNE
jgi:signal peptide peptidase-like protein 2B